MEINIKPSEIYFSHSKINPRFTGCKKLISESLTEITTGATKISAIPKIKLYVAGDRYISENNRRLFLFKELEKLGLLETITCRVVKAKNPKMFTNTYSKTAKLLKN